MSRDNHDNVWYERCCDCGSDVVNRVKSKREDICDSCWERRGWMIANATKIDSLVFQEIQRAMARHTGTAKRQIIKLQKELC